MRSAPLLVVPLLAAPMLAACTPTEADRVRSAADADAARAGLDRELAGLVPGTPMTCLPSYGRAQSRAYGPSIVYTVSRSLKYRTDTAGGCESIARNDILVVRSTSGQTCSGDIAYTVDPNSRFVTGSCSFRRFIPYRRP